MPPKRYAVALFISAVVLVLSILGTLATTTSFCGWCHRTEARSWSTSSHKTISCQFCHQRPGIIGVVDQRLRTYRMLSKTLLGETPGEAKVQSSFCIECHREAMDKVITKNSIRVRHNDFVYRGYECVLCHNKVAHGETVRIVKASDMDKCLDCHNGSTASVACPACHVSGERKQSSYRSPWRASHDSTWKYAHPLGKQSNCNVCHNQNFCVKCHGLELPHPELWLNLHGKEAKIKSERCLECHTRELCLGCHKTTMPHPDGFLAKHSDSAREDGRKTCVNCHTESSCDLCHNAHVHPGLKPERIQSLGEVR